MNNRPIQIVAWAWSVLACASFGFGYFYLTWYTNTLADFYAGLDVALPLFVRVVLAAHRYIYPVFFAGAAIMVVVKEVITRNKLVSLATTVVAVIGVFVAAGCIMIILRLPAVDFAEKLNK